MKIALCTPWVTRCGIYSYSRDLANAIAKLGHNVYIVRLIRFGLRDPEYYQTLAQNFPKDADVFVISHEYGLYNGSEHLFYSELKNLFPNKPIVTICHSVGNWEIDSLITNASNRVIVHNDFCYKRFGYPEKTRIIPHGLSPLQTSPPPRIACKQRLGIQPEVPIVGYVGYISSYKGLETLIEAMVNVPTAALLIGGGWFVEKDTPYIMNLKEQALKMLPSRCQWLGYISEDDLSTVYGAMDILCYLSRFSTESGALLTGLSHRCVTIASSLPPFKEKEKQGALMTFKNTVDLTCKIKQLLEDNELRTSLSEGARKYAQKNSWYPNIARKHIELYESVLAEESN